MASKAFLRSVPTRSLAALASAVGLTLASLAFLIDVLALGSHPIPRVLGNAMVLWASGFSVTVASVRRWHLTWFWPIATLTLVVYWTQVGRVLPSRNIFSEPVPIRSDVAALQAKLVVDYTGCVLAIMGAYSCFWWFIEREGRRYGRVHAEVELAREIHGLLVPPIERRNATFEFHGVSLPSGEVGGDLVDLVEVDGKWSAFVADVSGHGVGSGVVMAMVKSATRVLLSTQPDGKLSALLEALNRMLRGLGKRNMFVTFSSIASDGSGALELAVAGHPPMLHYRRATGTVAELTVASPALGLFDGRQFASCRFECEPGDLLLLLTDGLIEVFDRQGVELGLDRAKRALAENANRPLREISESLIRLARNHGAATDDQTLFLARRLPGTSQPQLGEKIAL